MYRVEFLFNGGWQLLDETESFFEAIEFASGYCYNIPDDQLRIKTPDGKIL